MPAGRIVALRHEPPYHRRIPDALERNPVFHLAPLWTTARMIGKRQRGVKLLRIIK